MDWIWGKGSSSTAGLQDVDEDILSASDHFDWQITHGISHYVIASAVQSGALRE